MNFKKVKKLKLELDKSQSEIILENRINGLFDLADLESEMMIEYYNKIVKPYCHQIGVNPNEYCGYGLYFYYNDDSDIILIKDETILEDIEIEIKFNSDIWKKTNQFFKKKKYEKVIKKISDDDYSDLFIMEVGNKFYNSLFYTVNQPFWKSNLTDLKLEYFFHKDFLNFIKVKNQENLNLNIILNKNFIKIYYEDHFVFNFDYQMATNKEEMLEMFLNLKREIEYQINIKKKKNYEFQKSK